MSDNSPRWPGSDGAPGLDFSPYRKPADSSDGVATDTVDPAADPTAEDAGSSALQGDATETLPAAELPTAPPEPTVSFDVPADAVAGAAVAAGAELGVVEPAPARKARPVRRTRKARLRLARIDPWSVMKTTFLFAIAFGVMLVVATFALWSVLAGSGALESVNTLINTLIGGEQDAAFKIEDYLSVQRILGFAVVISAIDVVIITAVATLFAFLYNLAAVVMGGLEVTLAED